MLLVRLGPGCANLIENVNRLASPAAVARREANRRDANKRRLEEVSAEDDADEGAAPEDSTGEGSGGGGESRGGGHPGKGPKPQKRHIGWPFATQPVW